MNHGMRQAAAAMAVRRRMLMAALLAAPARPAAADDPWQAAREGLAAILLRHAVAPGTGDPPGFRLGDCASQRTLSEAGRAQARAIGAALRARGIAAARVLSSAWCRATETAELLDLGPVLHEPALDSVFADRAAAPERTAALRRLLAGWTGPGALVLVTHQVNITALTGVFPASGEALLVYTGERAGAVALRVPPPSP